MGYRGCYQLLGIAYVISWSGDSLSVRILIIPLFVVGCKGAKWFGG